MMASSNNEIRPLVNALHTLLNRQLQQICATHGLKTSGVKAELQGRIRNALEEVYTADPVKFAEIRSTIRGLAPGALSNTAQPTMPGYHYAQGSQHVPQTVSGYGSPSVPGGSSGQYNKNMAHSGFDLQFKPSPFYGIVSRIGSIRTCEVMSQHRNSIHISIRVSEHPSLANLANLGDKSWRVMVFCSADNQGVQDIAFPHQSELKVNGGEIKANLRGLKGKPGTTRPVDVTDSLRLKPSSYNNNIEFTYALTSKVKPHDPTPTPTKFYLAAYLCRMVPVDDLVAKIRGRKIAKATVIREMNMKANDPDVVATSTVLSLQCPLSYTRLRTPCRSTLCGHIQCFDATSYLQLQEQGPQWICPVCNKPAPFENLAIDEYVKDILENTSDSLDQVTIEPNGQWKTQSAEPTPKRSTTSFAEASIDVDDDISVVADNTGYSNGKAGTPYAYSTPSHYLIGNATPSSVSREPSGTPKSKGKRTAAEVIDLTLSSDEDDEPLVRAPKRQNVGPSPGPSSYSSFSSFNHNSYHTSDPHY